MQSASGGFPQDRNGAFSALRIKFATGRTSASLESQGCRSQSVSFAQSLVCICSYWSGCSG
ncbi:hypothetical protein [Moorena producens]|uniref:hypothetical protein n=1 Tax=Moorena producens TaxID=1155739 RepID=UPI001314C73C|nr:hypothetical protein [Moorena producens]